jgi:hypothetical protein
MEPQVFDFAAYTLDVATRLKEIRHSEASRHYIEVDSLDGLGSMSLSGAKDHPPFLVAVTNTDEVNSSEATKRCFYTLIVLDKGSDDVKRKIAKDNCKAIGRKIKAKLKHDQSENLNGLHDLDIESISISSLPAMGEYVGVMMSFYVGEADVEEYDVGDWED